MQLFTIVASYTIGDWLVYMVTGSKNAEVLKNATNYLKFDTLFYFVTAVICVVRNAMQGLETILHRWYQVHWK